MNKIKIFKNAEFGEIRTVQINNETYFAGKDIAEALGYKNTKDALSTHVSEEDKRIIQRSEIATIENHIPKEVLNIAFVDGNIPNRGMTFINESGLYALIFGSKLESAKRFKHWVTSEILPSIRKTGGYIEGQETMTDSELIAKALIVVHKQLEERNKQIEQMQPKAIFADAVAASKTSILIGDLAKLISQNGVQIGQKRLFDYLRENGFLIKSGSSKNMPMQRYVEQGLFEIKESNVQNPDGSVRITLTTKVTGKGQVYFVNKFLKEVAE